jgi:hypothetical protein
MDTTEQPTRRICPKSPTGEDTHHLAPKKNELRCIYCGKTGSEILSEREVE